MVRNVHFQLNMTKDQFPIENKHNTFILPDALKILKSILFKKILTKSVHPKICKNSPHDLCKQKGLEIKTI